VVKLPFTYRDVIRNSIKVCWQMDDLLPADTALDLSRPQLPEAIARATELDFLNEREQLALNHLRSHSYTQLLVFVEEYIIAQTVHHAQAELFGDHEAVRALLRFSEEEVKHQMLFIRYGAAFKEAFRGPHEVLDNAAQVANAILGKSPMAAMLATLHLELMTQEHYTDSIRDQSSDPLFANLLKHHWMEEAQHSKIDMLELARMAEHSDREGLQLAFHDYLDIVAALDGLLRQQSEMDMAGVQAFCGRELTDGQKERYRAVQQDSYRRDFIRLSMSHPQFLSFCEQLWPEGARMVPDSVAAYQVA
jgi:para-aminobenzoate N-oxygenase AurF